MSVDLSFNKPIQKSEKTLFIKKIDINQLKEIKKCINNFFFDPNTYFSSDSPIRLGKKSEITDDTFLRGKKGKRLTALNISNSSRSKSHISKIEKEKLEKKFLDSDKYELIDNKKLKDVFDFYKKRINIQKQKQYLKYNNSDLPLNLNISLRNQQENLLRLKKYKVNKANLEKFLLKKSNKNKDDLIFNKIDNYLYKKEIINEIDNKKIITENNSRRDWVLSLRRPLKIEGIRKSIINTNTDKYPFWSSIIEKSNNLKVTSVKPGINLNSNYIKKVIKTAKTYTSLDDSKINKLKNLEEINIKGDDLFDIEFRREMDSKKRKILHKAFIDNGRIILSTDINNVFGKQTFYKNYDKNIYKSLNTSYK